MATLSQRATKPSITEKYGKKRNKKEEQGTSVAPINLDENFIHSILSDSTIPFEDRRKKIVEMMTVILESEEGVQTSQSNVKMTKDIVKSLLQRFIAHNRKSMEFTRDNPMHHLKESMQEVFDNYHEIVVGRSDLKNKLMSVDSLIAQVGGEDKLVVALVEAKSRSKEGEEKLEEVKQSSETVLRASTAVKALNLQMAEVNIKQKNLEESFMAFIRPGIQAELNTIHSNKKKLLGDIAVAATTRDEAIFAKEKAVDEYEALTSSEDYQVHEQISRILDIASPEFKAQLSELASATLDYVDDTERVMTQVRDQLEHLMGDVDGGLDVNINIREQVAILSSALQEANDLSSIKLSEFKAKNRAEGVSALEKLESDKISRAADVFISETSSTAASVTMISAEVQKIEIVLLSLRDQLSDGLSDADEQLLMATNTASASGMIMLNRAQTLGTLAQAVISRGQYMNEAEETFGDLAKDFERGLAVKAGRNDTIASLSSVVADLTEAMGDRNDVATNIAIESRELIGDLSDKLDDLRQVAEDTRELESRVNEELAKEAAAA